MQHLESKMELQSFLLGIDKKPYNRHYHLIKEFKRSNSIVKNIETHPSIFIRAPVFFFFFSSSPIPSCFSFLMRTAMPMTSKSFIYRRTLYMLSALAQAPYLWGFNRVLAALKFSSIGCPLFPLRFISRSDTSAWPNMQTSKLPSLIIRRRLHDVQKLRAMLVMNSMLQTKPGIL